MAFDLDWVSLETLEALAKNYGYGAVFSGIFLENLGIPLPGEAIVLVGGFMAGRGDLTLEGTILVPPLERLSVILWGIGWAITVDGRFCSVCLASFVLAKTS